MRKVALALATALATAALTAGGVTSAQAATTETNDTAASVSYSGNWTAQGGLSGYYNQDAHYSNTTNNKVTFSFTGTQVSWIGAKNSDHGQASVSVCDATGGNCGSASTVDTYATSSTPQQTLYSSSTLSSGQHTLVITLLSTANPNSSGHYTDVDAFIVTTTALTGTYYIDNAAGSGCSNAGAGTSTSAPWCSFTPINGQQLAAGAQILLKRGDTFTGELGRLYGSGTASSPIVLGAYGSGTNPHIKGTDQASDRGVWIEDGSYWTVQHLEISDVGAGLIFWYNTNGHNGLTINDIYTHDVKGVFAGSPAQNDLPGMYHSAGVLITGNVPVTTSATAVSGVTASNLTGYNNNDDFDISGFNANSGGQQGFLSTTLGNHSVSNVSLSNLYFHHGLSGENFDNLNNLTITAMRLDDTGYGGNSSGTTALFFWSSSTVLVSNSILNGEVSTSSPDQTETDLEAFDDHVRFLGNYFGHSAGSPIEILEINGYANNYQSSHEIGDNLFQDYGNGQAAEQITSQTPTNFNGTAHDNLHASSGSTFTNGLSNWTLTNNTAAMSSNAYSSSYQFSSTQGSNNWREQYYTTSGGWQDISPYDSANQRWGGNGYVSRFDLLPDTCATCSIARDWQAPQSGTISIRGRVLKDALGGDGVTARVTKNGTQIWPANGGAQSISANDTSGYDTNVSTTVSTGDSIRFEVSDGGAGSATGDLTAWAPVLAYQ